MEIKDDRLLINTAPVDAVGGAKPEPEERPAIRQITMDVKAKTNIGQLPDEIKKRTMDGSINAQMTVAQFTERATMCAHCQHFDNALWTKILAKWSASTDPFEQAELDQARAAVAMGQVKGGIAGTNGDIDAALRPMGICSAYSRLFREMGFDKNQALTIVHPLGVCPGSMRDGTTLPKLFKKKKGVWDKLRDTVLFKSAGKKA